MYYPKLISRDGRLLGNFNQPTSKVICIGRNYKAHAEELNNPVPESPILFIKSSNCLVDIDGVINIPKKFGECHHELELALLIGKALNGKDDDDYVRAVVGVGLGLDLTLRELQSNLKSKGQPWEKAKSFDGACPLTGFIPISEITDIAQIDFELIKNANTVQKGNSADMIFSVEELLEEITLHFTLFPGDIVLTGTPSGVGPLVSGDRLKLKFDCQLIAETKID